MTTIAYHVADCLKAFRQLEVHFDHDNDQHELAWITDQLGRFKIWSGNCGAHHHTGQISLDYRLRDASHLRSRVLSLLESIIEALKEAYDTVMGNHAVEDDLSGSDDSDEDKRGTDDVELDQIKSAIAETISCLLRLSIAIKHPAPHDRFLKSKTIDMSHHEEWDIAHVRTKFPQAHEYLIERLGKAISRRREYLKYREQHHEKLSCEIAYNDTITEASSLPEKVKKPSFTLVNDDDSDTRFSDTSYATTLPGATMSVPKMPPGASNGEPFECPFCYMIVSVQNRYQWKKHIYSDLQPYICLSKDCTFPNQSFSQRHMWAEHEKSHFASSSSEEGHDPPSFDLSNELKCPLCCQTQISLEKSRKHLASHQEELALFALPISKLGEHESEEIEIDNAINNDDKSDFSSLDFIADSTSRDEKLDEDIPGLSRFAPNHPEVAQEAGRAVLNSGLNLDSDTASELASCASEGARYSTSPAPETDTGDVKTFKNDPKEEYLITFCCSCPNGAYFAAGGSNPSCPTCGHVCSRCEIILKKYQ